MLLFGYILTFITTSIAASILTRGYKSFDEPAKEVTHDISKASRNGLKGTFETTRKLVPSETQHSEDLPLNEKHVLTKHTCHPKDVPEIDELDYSDCKEFVAEGLQILYHPDQFNTTPELLEKYGYPYMEYRLVTRDKYILTIYRIIGSPKLRVQKAHNTPIYINHGLCGSSDLWFFMPPDKNMVFMMANEGYDVWLSNARGTTYSLGHETSHYNDSLAYWDFSFHEMGIYDVPAVTDMILKETGHKSTLYLGYSMGTTELLVAQSELPEINNKIRAAFFFAPVAFTGHSTSLVRSLAPFTDTEEAYHTINTAFHGRFRSNKELREMKTMTGSDVCAASAAKCGLCDNALFALCGVNPRQLNKSALPFIFEKFPNSASVKSFAHFAQLVTSCRFQKFDYMPATNMKLYGSLRPPLYDLRNVRSPLYIYHGENDNFGLPVDVHKFANSLRHGVVKKVVLIEDKYFTHFDFCSAKDADKLVYKGLLRDMQQYIDVR